MKTIMISIKPEWLEKILNGEKIIEVRKFNIEPPFKVIMYCTKGRNLLVKNAYNKFEIINKNKLFGLGDTVYNGKAVGEFICNNVKTYYYDIDPYNMEEKMYYIKTGELDKTCIGYDDLIKYGNGKTLYGYYIDDLKVYERPKELSDFYRLDTSCPFYNPDLERCDSGYNCNQCVYNDLAVKRPPQNYIKIMEV